MIVYVDSSVLVALLAPERQSAAAAQLIRDRVRGGAQLVTSALCRAEVRRVMLREVRSQDAVATGTLLDSLAMVDLDKVVADTSALVPDPPPDEFGNALRLRASDAVHVASALLAGASEFVSLDARQLQAARGVGLRTVDPADR